MAIYPFVSLPTPETPVNKPVNKVQTACLLQEAGFAGKAEQALNQEFRMAPLNDKTLTTLKSKHPQGKTNPFDAPLHLATALPELPDKATIKAALRGLSPDMSPGVSGWSVNLLRLAAKSPTFLCFLTTLTGLMANGLAPARSLLCSSQLTLLLRSENGIRPVAVGELFYRLAMKAIFKANYWRNLLAKNQFGVGCKGGVKPNIQAVQRAAEGDPLFPTHTFSLSTWSTPSTLYNAAVSPMQYARRHRDSLGLQHGLTTSQLLFYSGLRKTSPPSCCPREFAKEIP